MGARKEEGLREVSGSCLGAAAAEVSWGQRLFAQLVCGISPGKADGRQSLVQLGEVAGSHACSPWGAWGAPLDLFLVLSPDSSGHPEAGPWAPGTRCRELGLFPLLPAAEGCLLGLVPRDMRTCSTPGRDTCFCSSSWRSLVGTGMRAKPMAPGPCYGQLAHICLVAGLREEEPVRVQGRGDGGGGAALERRKGRG